MTGQPPFAFIDLSDVRSRQKPRRHRLTTIAD